MTVTVKVTVTYADMYIAPENFDYVDSVKDWKLDGNTLRLIVITHNGKEATISFDAVNKNIWRFRFVPPDAELPTPSPSVVLTQYKSLNLQVKESENAITITGAQLSPYIKLRPWSFKFVDSKGREVLGDNPLDVDGLGKPFVLPLGYVFEGETIEKVPVTTSFHLRQDEHLFGLGEKFTPLDKRMQKIISWTVDALGSTSERSHKNIPFLISARGYGLFIDGGGRITWDLGTSSCQSYTVINENTSFDAYIIYGPTPAKILKHYSDLTGYAPVPPKWSFGLWLSSGGTYRDKESIEQLLNGREKHHIPADVIHIDPWWMEWRKYCDFNWNHSTFPNPVEWIESIHKRGLKICLWEHPYISVESDLFQFGTQKNYFVKHPDGSVYVIDYGLSLSPRPDGVVRTVSPDNSWNARVAIIDLTNPNAYNWFKDLHRPLLKMGIDVFKTDFGEDIPADAVFHNEQTGATMHNMYPLLYNKAVFEVTQEEKGYGLVWSRSATAGNQRYPTCWSGDPAADFDSLACTIRGGLSIGMSGIPFWSNDIGSYRGTPSPQLYIRWAQFGLFCSHSRMHGDSPREPWHFGKKALAIVRRYVELRYRFFPYIYSTSIEASKTGMPVLRALPLAFPNDPNTFNKDLEFLFGENFLVAPIYNESNWRTIYFPKGRWISFWDGTIVEGEQNLLVNAPLEILPLYVRAGAIIPTMELVEHIPEGLINPLIVDVFPSENGTYTFYEDDAETKFNCEQTQKMIHFEWRKLNPRKMIVRFVGVRKPKNCKGGAMKFAKGVCTVSLDAVKDGKIILGY